MGRQSGRSNGSASTPMEVDAPLSLTVELPPVVMAEIVRQVAATLDLERGDDGFLDVAGAADFLACGKDRIYSLVSARRIPFHKDGSRTLFDRAELRQWVRRGGGKRP